MNGEHGARRIVLGAFVVVLAALAVLSNGRGVAAAEKYPLPDQKSAAAFQASCEKGGGKFTGPTPFGYTICSKGDNKIVCDKNGKDCSTNVPPARVSGPSNPRLPSGSVVGVLEETGDDDEGTGDAPPRRVADGGGPAGTIILVEDDEP
jgi:hypothetical protein